jgi:hypothetical protein
VVPVLFVLLLIVAVITASLVVAWPRGGFADAADRKTATRSATAEPERAVQPESLEGALVGQLMTGEITRRQYLHAMCRLAARDAERHPLEVPPDVVPPESA